MLERQRNVGGNRGSVVTVFVRAIQSADLITFYPISMTFGTDIILYRKLVIITCFVKVENVKVMTQFKRRTCRMINSYNNCAMIY